MGTGNLDVEIDLEAPGLVGVLADVLNQTIHNLKWHIDRLNQQATQDPMTGVKNKRAWQNVEKRINEEIKAGAACFAIAVCDVNGLKQINDTVGHEAGDSLIIRASRHICKVFKHSPVYRIGGDEFTVILEGSDLTNREELLAEFYAEMAEQPKGDPTRPPVSIALGISHYMPCDQTFADVFHRADEAMYQKKAAMKENQWPLTKEVDAMQGFGKLSHEEAWIFLRRLCVRIIQMEDGWELVHQLDLETALGLLSGGFCPVAP